MNSKKTRDTILFGILFCAVVLFSFWKSRFGFATLDEGFYLSIPYRLCQGDALFRDEWHLSLMVGPILYPIMRVYLGILGGTQGIFLHFRWIYLFLQGLTAIFLYAKMRKVSPVGALLGSLLYLLFSPYNIMALSYNTIGMLLFSVICISYVTAEAAPSAGKTVGYGFLFALSVLCCPYLVLLYSGYGLVICVRAVRTRVCPKPFLWFTLGCTVAAAAFCLFVFRRITVEELVTNLRLMMNDPEHGTPLYEALPRFLLFTFQSVRFAPMVLGLYAVLLAAVLLDKQKRKRKQLYFLLSLAISGLYILLFMAFDRLINCLMVPVTAEAVFCMLLSERSRRREWLFLFLPTLCYSIAICASSNQQFHALSAVFVVTAAYAFVPMAQLVRELPNKRPAVWAASAFAVLLFGSCLFLRWKQTAADTSTYLQTAVITQGSCKGLITTDKKKFDYDTYYENTQPLRTQPQGNILYYSDLTWFYLDDAKRSATYSAWMAGMWDHLELPRLQAYYAVNPAKRPDYIFIDRAHWAEPNTVLDTLGLTGAVTEVDYGFCIRIDP